MTDERREFEKWFTNGGEWAQAAQRSGEGYRLMQAQSAWEAWQAAWAAAGVPPKESLGAQKPLAEGHLFALLEGCTEHLPTRLPPGWVAFARAIERAHGIKGDSND